MLLSGNVVAICSLAYMGMGVFHRPIPHPCNLSTVSVHYKNLRFLSWQLSHYTCSENKSPNLITNLVWFIFKVFSFNRLALIIKNIKIKKIKIAKILPILTFMLDGISIKITTNETIPQIIETIWLNSFHNFLSKIPTFVYTTYHKIVYHIAF